MIATILVPTDGSPQARKAVDLAADLASKYGARIVLVHVLLAGDLPEGLLRAAQVEHVAHLPKADAQRLAGLPAEIMARNKKGERTQIPVDVLEFVGHQVMLDAERRIRNKGVNEVKRLVREGDAAREILAAAASVDADMIVMGRRGLSVLKGLLVGSVSDKVTHLAACTCVTVR